MAQLFVRMLKGCLVRRQTPISGGISCFWDASTPNEQTIDPERRYFPWIVDGYHIDSDQVLFLLGNNAKPDAGSEGQKAGYRAITDSEMYANVPKALVLRSLISLGWLVFRSLIPVTGGLGAVQRTRFTTSVLRMEPLIDHYKPSYNVTNSSRLGNEDPAVTYMNAAGVETIIYCDSAAGYLFVESPEQCEFLDPWFVSVSSSKLLVWNQVFADWVRQHSADGPEVIAIGPLMPGAEAVTMGPRKSLRKSKIPKLIDDEDTLFISWFDVAPVAQEIKNANNRFPMPYTQEYSSAFFKDMLKLLQDFDQVALIFKPKRKLNNPRFSYPKETMDIVEKLNASSRAVVVDDDTNPWVPIAIADLCIGMPFTSPVLAAWHHGIPALYHDPTGIALNHKYQAVSDLITHDYSQLKSKVSSLLREKQNGTTDKEAVWSDGRGFIGADPGSNTSDRFRDLLCKARKEEAPI
jgi:hypothetical protein